MTHRTNLIEAHILMEYRAVRDAGKNFEVEDHSGLTFVVSKEMEVLSDGSLLSPIYFLPIPDRLMAIFPDEMKVSSANAQCLCGKCKMIMKEGGKSLKVMLGNLVPRVQDMDVILLKVHLDESSIAVDTDWDVAMKSRYELLYSKSVSDDESDDELGKDWYWLVRLEDPLLKSLVTYYGTNYKAKMEGKQ